MVTGQWYGGCRSRLSYNSKEVRMKQIYFYSGLPRAGNTLLSCILNQNPSIRATAYSILPETFYRIENVRQHDLYQMFPDEASFENISKNIFNSYYQDWDNIVIERGDWITPFNFNLLRKYFSSEIKIVVLVRDMLDIIKSYLSLCAKNPNFYVNREYNELDPTTIHQSEIEEKCDIIMKRGEHVHTILYSIKWMLDNNNRKYLHFVHYNDLIKNPENIINGIYKFFNIDPYTHKYTHLKQLTVNKVQYNDEYLGGEMHTIRTNKIEPIEHDISLPSRVIAQYSGMNFREEVFQQ